MDLKDTVDKILDQELKRFAKEFIDQRLKDVSKIKDATGSGKKEFDYAQVKANSGFAAVLIEFNDYMRYHDMRQGVAHNGLPNIDAIKGWIEQKGLGQFKLKNPNTRQSRQSLINSLAWGIALTMKNRGKWNTKRTRWYSKPREKNIQSLYGRLLYFLSEEYLQQTKSDINGNQKG
jgi:hypothetical protein